MHAASQGTASKAHPVLSGDNFWNLACTTSVHNAGVKYAGCSQKAADPALCACRIWNHRRQECVLKRQLTDDPVDLSMHCSGLMLLIAYSDRLQLLYILRCVHICQQLTI